MIADLKPYPAYKDSGVPWLGEIPEHWEILPNRAVFTEIKERNHPDADMLSVTISKGVIRQRALLEDSSKKDSSNLDKAAYKLVRRGDIAYNKMRAWQGAIGISEYQGIVSPAYVIQRPRIGADSRYLHYLLRTPAFAKEAERWSYGITSDMWSLRPEHFRLIYICFPPLPEQHAITRYLDHVDRRIRRYIRAKQKLIALLEEQKQAIIHHAVTRGLDPTVRLKPSGVEWLGDVPEHWERFRLKTLLKSVDRRSIDGEQPLLSLRRDHGIVRYDEHFARPPQAATTIGYKIVEVGQIVVNRLQANNGLIFRAGIEGLVSPDYSVFYARDYADPEFLARLIRTSVYKAHFRRVATGLGTGTAGFLRLYDDDLLDTLVYLPPIEQQLAIVEFLDQSTADTNSAIARTEHEIALLREYRTRLITDVVTGQVDVREAAAGLPAEVEEPLATDDDEALGEEIEEDDMDLVDEEEG